jgi:general secretion pathway protein A
MLQKFLLETNAAGQIAALIVDEAHKLSPELLEEIRLLGNLEHPEGKLLQILLSGQNELDDVLNSPQLWQLKQRISLRLEVGPLDRSTIEPYLRHRWVRAGGSQHIPFESETIDRIYHWSQGIPRLINSLCDNALTLAFAEKAIIVRAAHVDEAARDLRLPGRAAVEAEAAPVPKPTAAAETPAPAGATEEALIPATAAIEMPVLERYRAEAGKSSLFMKWIGKLGFAYGGRG